MRQALLRRYREVRAVVLVSTFYEKFPQFYNEENNYGWISDFPVSMRADVLPDLGGGLRFPKAWRRLAIKRKKTKKEKQGEEEACLIAFCALLSVETRPTTVL